MRDTPQNWDAGLYQDRHSFVWKHAAGLIDVLAPQPGERILDLGCGTGQLAEQIAAAGAAVVGIDNSPEMVEQARRNFPGLRFERADATTFDAGPWGGPFDAVFSNAVLHWVKPPAAAADRIWHALRPGGRFVAEFGGKHNVGRIHTALRQALGDLGLGSFDALDPWYFPGVGEYAGLLEARGFDVTMALLFDRPTPLEDGERGMANWLRMFGGPVLAPLGAADRDRLVDETCRRLRPLLFDKHDGRWTADYRRLRVVAYRPPRPDPLREGEAPAEPRSAALPGEKRGEAGPVAAPLAVSQTEALAKPPAAARQEPRPPGDARPAVSGGG